MEKQQLDLFTASLNNMSFLCTKPLDSTGLSQSHVSDHSITETSTAKVLAFKTRSKDACSIEPSESVLLKSIIDRARLF